MINEIGTLLLNKEQSESLPFYVDPDFKPVTIPTSLSWAYNLIVGDTPEKSVPYLLGILQQQDIQQYLNVFDSRTLYPDSEDTLIYDLLKNKQEENRLLSILEFKQSVAQLFYGDDYISTLKDLYYQSPEGIIRVCAIILALAYKLKKLR